MAQGEFTKKEADTMRDALDEIMKAMPARKVGELIGNFNDLFLFIGVAKKNAPDK